MSHKSLQQAIDLIREGKTDAGARMLQIVIRDEELLPKFRATAYAWLAETQDDLNFKIQCLSRAVDSDPTNTHIQERLNVLLSVQTPNKNAPVQRAPQSPDNQQGGQKWRNGIPPGAQEIRVIKPDTQSLTLPQFDPPEKPKRKNVDGQATGQFSIVDPESSFETTDSMPALPQTSPDRPPPMPTPPSANPPRPHQNISHLRLQQPPRVVGIRHGPNGIGSGFFVTTDGIIATTRYIVGGSQEVSVELETGQELPGTVVRSYPLIDLAFLHVNVVLDQAWPPTNLPVIPEDEPLIFIGFSDNPQRGYRRKSKAEKEQYWIPTSVDVTQLTHGGGNAIFDSRNYLVGLLTRNTSRSSGLLYGLHIMKIYEVLRDYLRDRQQMPNMSYCPSCGNSTRAQQFGGYYCETCGTELAGFKNIQKQYRTNPQLAQIYNENLSRPCPYCGARVGFHEGRCLRCGYDLDSKHI